MTILEIPFGKGGDVVMLTAMACGVYVMLNLHAAAL
jgi:hypothetical protein